MRLWLAVAALSGLIAVGLGAYAAHGGATDASASASHWVEVAWRYQMAHTLLLLFLALWLERSKRATLLHLAGGFSVLGLVLFSGSLYAMALAGLAELRSVVPFGGLAFLLAWGCLLAEALIGRRQS